MSSVYFISLALLAIAGFFTARQRAAAVFPATDAAPGSMHSLPAYHGLLAATVAFVPMLLVYAVGAPILDRQQEAGALSLLGGDVVADPLKRGAALREIYNLAAGQYSGQPSAELRAAADAFVASGRRHGWILLLSGGALGLSAPAYVLSRISPTFRARNHFERFVLAVLIMCPAVAVLTTIGIVFSVAYETWRFFWAPRSRGDQPSTSSCSARSGTRRPRCAPTRATSRRLSASFGC